MENIQKERIKERLESLGLSVLEATRRAGLSKSMVQDLLSGKKQSIKPKYIPGLAKALECDPEYIMGFQSELVVGGPQVTPLTSDHMVGVFGVCELRSWRHWDAMLPVDLDPWSVEIDFRYPASIQEAFLVVGSDAEPFGISNKSAVVVGDIEELRKKGRSLSSGDIVLVRNQRDDTYEYSIRKYVFEDDKLVLRSGFHNKGVEDTYITETNIIYGIVLCTRRYY